MNKKRAILAMLLTTLFVTLMATTGVSAATATNTITTSATANYTLYYDSSTGVMYKDEYGSAVYTGQADKWSQFYSTETGNHVLVLKGFDFTSSLENALVLPYATTICLIDHTSNNIISTYQGENYGSGIYALDNLTIYSNGNGTGNLFTKGGKYSDGIYCENLLTVKSGEIMACGGTAEGSAGIDTFSFKIYSGDVIASSGDFSLYFIGEDNRQVINYEKGAIFQAGNGAQVAAAINITNNSANLALFDNYAYLHIYDTLTDVPYTAWYYQNVYAMYDAQYIKGYGNSDGLSYEIRPANPITRAEFVTVLARLFNSEDELNQYAGNYAFTDIPDWASKYVGWAAKSGYVDGINATYFGAAENITREQMATILYRIITKMELTTDVSKTPVTFTDTAQISDYAKDAVAAMQKVGVINGSKNSNGSYSFYPKGDATRAEAITMIYNFINAYAK